MYNKIKTLENILFEFDDIDFPTPPKNQATYIKLYKDFSEILEREYYDSISLGASKNSNGKIYLNDHGKSHINKVMERASEIYHFFYEKNLSPIEIFLLLCAIRVHDVGNIYGREKHESKIDNILKNKLQTNDNITKKIIYNIATSHGGKIENCNNSYYKKDKISILQPTPKFHGKEIRLQLLAAILRLADELSDDYTRADYRAIEENELKNEISEIYHEYSKSLSSVMLKKNEITNNVSIELYYDVPYNIILKKFKSDEEDIIFINEIKSRIIKMESERLYCMRFLQPNIYINEIKYEIDINNSENELNSESYIISGKIGSNGYPEVKNDNINIPSIDEIEKEIKIRGWKNE